MSGFAIDASIALAWCFDDEATDATRALLDRFEDEHAEVPSLWHLELANAQTEHAPAPHAREG